MRVDAATGTLIGGVVVAIITFVINPWVQARLKKQQENDPTLGWRTAVEEVKNQAIDLAKRVTALETENTQLEEKVAHLTEQVNDKSDIIRKLEQVVESQSNMIFARDARIAQLVAVYKASTATEPPPPDPAFVYWLTKPVIQ